MSRNGAGVFAVINPILIGALRSSTAVNQDFSDAGTDITNTLPLDGTVGMNGQFKAADGIAALPGITFASEPRTGFRRNGPSEMRWVGGGVDRFYIDLSGKAWHLGAMDVAGAFNQQGAMTGTGSDPVLISQFATNGAAKRTGNPVWAPEPMHYTLQTKLGGVGAVLPTGIVADLQAPADGTIVAAALAADQSGSLSVDVWKDTYANYPPTIADVISSAFSFSSSLGLLDQTLAGWTTAVSAGDCFRFNINSITSVTRLTIALRIKRFG
jgi:hypothetical protein